MSTIEATGTEEHIEGESIQILTWKIGDQFFGMDLRQCKEVEKNMAITPVPHAPDYVAGIVNLRGDVVTVLDLKILLGHTMEKTDRTHHVMIRVKSDSTQIAIRADELHDILEVHQDQLEEAGSHLNEEETRYIESVVITDSGLVLVINGETLLHSKAAS